MLCMLHIELKSEGVLKDCKSVRELQIVAGRYKLDNSICGPAGFEPGAIEESLTDSSREALFRFPGTHYPRLAPQTLVFFAIVMFFRVPGGG